MVHYGQVYVGINSRGQLQNVPNFANPTNDFSNILLSNTPTQPTQPTQPTYTPPFNAPTLVENAIKTYEIANEANVDLNLNIASPYKDTTFVTSATNANIDAYNALLCLNNITAQDNTSNPLIIFFTR